MRIDYSPPRRSTTGASSTGKQRSPGNSSLRSAAVIAVLGSLVFSIGFGTGWYFSQQATKRAFRAAMEQNSLESSPRPEHPVTPPPAPPVAAPIVAPPAAPVAAAPGTTQTAPQKPAAPPDPATPPLSFYEALPSGQKNTVLGSGINEKAKPAPVVPQPAAVPPKPAEATAPSPQPAPVSASATAGWVVQVAAFSSQKEAETLKAKLAAKGYTASVMETNLNDKGTWYRVRIGRHMTKEAATDIASRIGGGAKALPDQD